MQPFTCLLQENQKQMESVLEQDLEALSTNDLLNYIVYDTIYPSPPPQITNLPLNNDDNNPVYKNNPSISEKPVNKPKRKRRRREKVCKNKEEAETQRMTHITVERNRRKQMNGHLAVLKSLMPDSYVQRGDQASIVGGAIEYVKELEHLLQTLESQKLFLHHRTTATSSSSDDFLQPLPPPFSQFFSRPQYTWTTNQNHMNNNIINNNDSCTILVHHNINNNNSYYTYNNNATSSSTKSNDVANIEVSLIETHANVRILSRKSFSQLSKMVAAFHSLSLSILHLNVTTLDPLVLYSISAKVEEGCQLTSADDIAGAVHHMLRIIEDEVSLC